MKINRRQQCVGRVGKVGYDRDYNRGSTESTLSSWMISKKILRIKNDLGQDFINHDIKQWRPGCTSQCILLTDY